jgi:hypothetical protein
MRQSKKQKCFLFLSSDWLKTQEEKEIVKRRPSIWIYHYLCYIFRGYLSHCKKAKFFIPYFSQVLTATLP